jgi:hypothetical protein
MSAPPTTIREIDSSPVEMAQAQQEWAIAARSELERVARSYGDLIRYAELAEAVQVSTGVRTSKLMRSWIGDVLTLVGADCHERSEPLLSALCVQKDGTIGDGYGVALVKIYGGDPPTDLDQQAAEERLRCYQHFDAVMPADGGRAQLPPEVTARRRKAAKQAREDAPKATCPKCNIVLPAMANGHCYYCDE